MMWNVYVCNGGSCDRINSQPYDSEQVAMLLETLNGVAMLLLLRYDGHGGDENGKVLELDNGASGLGDGQAERKERRLSESAA
jgi:hypothetical protein